MPSACSPPARPCAAGGATLDRSVSTPVTHDPALPARIRNARGDHVCSGALPRPASSHLAGLFLLEHLLHGTPEAGLIPLLHDQPVNADGFPYPHFLQLVQRLCEDAEPRDIPVVRERLRTALRARADHGGFDPPLARHLAGTLLGGVPWAALHAAASAVYGSQARLAMVAAQLATTVLPRLSEGSWRAAAGVLQQLPLDALLPSLRSIDQIDAVIRAMPDDVADGLWNLHERLHDVGDTLAPTRPATLALVAVAAVLWTLYERALPPLPPVRGHAARSALVLPQWARTATQWHRRLAALFAPAGAVPRERAVLEQDIAGFAEMKQQLDAALLDGLDDDTALHTVMALQ